jgi:hypothetical protein
MVVAAARNIRAPVAVAAPALRVARTNRIKRGVFLRDAACAVSSGGDRRHRRHRCCTHAGHPATAAADDDDRNFFATGC